MPPQKIEALPIEWVDKAIIRQYFNDNHFAERALMGEFHISLKRNSHCQKPPEGEPFCTHSQIEYYFDRTNELIAIVHQYRRPDGTLGGSGKPDPKRIYLPDRILSVRSG